MNTNTMLEPTFVEYQVRPITRYAVTRFWRSPEGCGSEQKGEYDNNIVAHEVGYALCKEEHSRLGWPIDDARIQYPKVSDMAAGGVVPVPAAA